MKVLIADDAPDVAEVVAFGVRMIWPECQVFTAHSGREALRRFAEESADIIVLDISMPPPDGYEVCRIIRATSQVPILFLSVHDSTLDKVRGLDLGADDYLVKPFDHLELLARLRALARRSGGTSTPVAGARFSAGDFSLDYSSHQVRVGDRPVALTSTEYRLLEELVRHAGTAMPHRYLLQQVWGQECMNDVHYLKVFVRRLRQKLGGDDLQNKYIQTEWGTGYRFAPTH